MIFVFLSSFNTIISRSIHIAENSIISFFFMAEYSIVYTYHIFFIHSSVNGHLSYFPEPQLVAHSSQTCCPADGCPGRMDAPSCHCHGLLSPLSCTFKRFIWLHQVLVWGTWDLRCHEQNLSCRMQALSSGIWDLVSWPGIEPRLPALEAQGLNHWTARELPSLQFWLHFSHS